MTKDERLSMLLAIRTLVDTLMSDEVGAITECKEDQHAGPILRYEYFGSTELVCQKCGEKETVSDDVDDVNNEGENHG